MATFPDSVPRQQFVGEIQKSGVEPERVTLFVNEVAKLHAAEVAAGIEFVDGDYDPGHVLRYGENTVPGTTDMLDAINAAVSTGLPLYFPEQVFAHSAEIDFTNAKFAHFDNTTFQPSMATGNAVKWEAASGAFVEGYSYTGLLTVDWQTADWTADTTSFYVQNVFNSVFYLSSIHGTVGLRLHGDARGVVHNDFHLGKFSNHNVGVWLSAETAAGWCNSNRFHGGFFLNTGSETASGSLHESIASHIYIENTPYDPRGNTFIRPSLEYVGTGFRVARMGGLRNTLQVGWTEVNSGDTTWIVDTGTKNTIDCFSTPFLEGYDSTIAGSANRLDVSGATEPYVLAPQGYVDFDGKGIQEYRNNHSTNPTARLRNAGGGPTIELIPSADSANTFVIRNPGNTVDNIVIRNGTWIMQNNTAQIVWRAAAAPVGDTWAIGDKHFNSAPSVDGNDMILLGWICTVAGTPGTWEPMYVSNVTPAT